MTEKIKVWITKYALTSGISEATAGYSIGNPGNVVVSGNQNEHSCQQYFHRGEWHLSKNDAVEQAYWLRNKKIKSLEKQIEKLKKMEF